MNHATLPIVPKTVPELLSPQWLTFALQRCFPGVEVASVEVVHSFRTMAVKTRIKVTYSKGGEGVPTAFFLKGFFDVDELTAAGQACSIMEANFYDQIAPHLKMRLAPCYYYGVDQEAGLGIIIIEDLAARGAHFMTALEPFNVARAERTLEQLAILHAHSSSSAPPAKPAWLVSMIGWLASHPVISIADLQKLLDGPRREGLDPRVVDAATLQKALNGLAAKNAEWKPILIHGDTHTGNLFELPEGPGFVDWQTVQWGSWSLDIAYHINAVLPIELAAKNERDLLRHYLECVKAAGGVAPSFDEAWDKYRTSVIYGYYLWAITRRVVPEVINVLVNRLGNAVMRHDSFGRVGVK